MIGLFFLFFFEQGPVWAFCARVGCLNSGVAGLSGWGLGGFKPGVGFWAVVLLFLSAHCFSLNRSVAK
jgi:hypothetical protein